MPSLRTTHSVWTDWDDLPEERRAAIRAWLREIGVEPNGTVSVTLIGEGRVTVEQLVPHPNLPQVDRQTRVVTAPVAPPPEWWP